jgi:hypothetical protein
MVNRTTKSGDIMASAETIVVMTTAITGITGFSVNTIVLSPEEMVRSHVMDRMPLRAPMEARELAAAGVVILRE